MIDDRTKIVATRAPHDRLARNQLPGADRETACYPMLSSGVNAIHLHYCGPQIGDDGQLPVSGLCTFYLLEVEEYVEAEG